MDQQTALKDETVAVSPSGKRRRRGHVRVFERWCKGCGLCAAFCPQEVFEVSLLGKSIVAHGERCTACEWCYVHCPDCAISVQLLDEAAGGGQG